MKLYIFVLQRYTIFKIVLSNMFSRFDDISQNCQRMRFIKNRM